MQPRIPPTPPTVPSGAAAATPAADPGATPAAPPAPGRLLVVDDNEMNRDMLSRRLARRGHHVLTASGGREALALLAAHPDSIDVVLLDIMMPDIDGLQVLRTVRQTRSPENLPIIMATAKDAADDVVQALAQGASDYVTKPLEFSIVLARVETQLRMKRSVDRIVALERDLAQQNLALSATNVRMRRDLALAARVQQAMLPAAAESAPPPAALEFAWRYRPCDELGGDILGVFPLDERHTIFYVLDVSGHGVAASLLSVTVGKALAPVPGAPSLIRRVDPASGALVPVAPHEVAQGLNARFPMEAHADLYFTLFYAVLDRRTGLLRFATAAHPPMLHLRAGQARPVGLPAFAIGWFEDAEYATGELLLEPGDRLFITSDGLLEAADGRGRHFGVERLADTALAAANRPLDDAVAAILAAGEAFAPRFADDVTLLAAEFRGP